MCLSADESRSGDLAARVLHEQRDSMWPQQLTPSRATAHAAYTHQTPWSGRPQAVPAGFSDEENSAHVCHLLPSQHGLACGQREQVQAHRVDA